MPGKAGDDGKPAGYSVDLCTRIAASVAKELALPNLQVKWVKVTPANRIQSVVNGTVDLECGSTTASLSRQEQVDFSLMTFVDGASLLTAAGTNWRGLADLTDKRIAVIPGTTTERPNWSLPLPLRARTHRAGRTDRHLQGAGLWNGHIGS